MSLNKILEVFIMNLKSLITVSIIILMSGCNYSSNKEAKDLTPNIEELEKKLNELETEIAVVKMQSERYDSAAFDPAQGKGFQRIDTSTGTFLISLQDVTPHLDGVKVKINIGNIQSAEYTGFTVIAEYSKRYPKYIPQKYEDNKKNREDYNNSKRTKEEKFTQSLKGGAWNTVQIVLPDIKPVDFGSLYIKINTNTVKLYQN